MPGRTSDIFYIPPTASADAESLRQSHTSLRRVASPRSQLWLALSVAVGTALATWYLGTQLLARWQIF